MKKTANAVMIRAVKGSCDLCDNKPPHMCGKCNKEIMAAEPLDIFEPHAGRKSIVGSVPADFYFV